ncbi:Gfo/Idh/MocA family protein [Flavobacterium sp. W21_SRS_FM6]|uniref:Gfo/Idh/MocA family protein n=1 Tax=Flavobacterium sp. W21_SRS_FM6 TaxID=3240268 RepID=UPI003F910D43
MLAIIGFGDHVQRNILPALEKLQDVVVKYVVVRDLDKYKHQTTFFFITDFSEVLADKDITSIYIATPISSHYKYVKEALTAGKNVLCEKSLSVSFEDSEELVNLAKKTNVKLHEVVMYQYHDQFIWLKNYLKNECNGRLVKIYTSFQIPHLSPDNIRYSKNLGGGALLDVGFYPLSMIISLLGMPNMVKSIITGQPSYSVDLSGIAIFSYKELYAVAEWGIGRLYKSEIILEFEDKQVTVGRAFSKPPSLQTVVTITKNNGKREEILINPCDHFYRLFSDFFNSGHGDLEHLEGILERAKIIDAIKNNL